MKGLSYSGNCLNCQYTCVNAIFTREELQLINSNRSEMNFAAGEVILRQGSFVSQVLYLKQGIVKKVLEGKNERNTIIKLADDKNFLALPILGSSNQYPFSIVSVSDCHVCLLKRDTIYKVIKGNEKAHDFIMKWYAEDYLQMYRKIATISTRNSHGKLATALLYLTNGTFSSNILDLISRKDLAELSSTSKESANKILQQLNHDGLIEINKDRIIIKRRDLLEKLSSVG